MSSIVGVLGLPPLVTAICRFQDGVCEDFRPFVKLSLPLHNNRPLAFLDAWKTIDDVLTPWIATAQPPRLLRFLDDLPHMKCIATLYCIYTGNLATLQTIHTSRWDLLDMDDNLVDLAAAGGHVPMLRYLFDTIQHPGCTEKSIVWATERGHVDAIVYLVDVRRLDPALGLSPACEAGNLPLIQLLRGRLPPNSWYLGIEATRLYLFEAIAHGHLDTVVPYFLNLLEEDIHRTIELAACRGYLPALKYLLPRSDRHNDNLLVLAARVGHLGIVEWLMAINYPMKLERGFRAGAACGQLKTVKFLQPYIARMELYRECFFHAMESNRFDIADYLMSFFSDRQIQAWLERAVIQGNLRVVQHLWRPRQGNRRALAHAARYDRLDILQWLVAQEDTSKQLPSLQKAMRIAVKYNQSDVQAWLIETIANIKPNANAK
ncbi:hypothetical protein LEN26_019331 [Aphanomyces euteiches]|nr:hypothetical protein LEN26_019331 [Aphanomyces euteiches]KAH9122102.1 hypothetical protein AeMF1_006470 [Aphanomyces euteiches]KAH9165542.1 hypothetical protein AeNC1_018493 [Aphanomyces euteiches]